jgi:hypothetical protein
MPTKKHLIGAAAVAAGLTFGGVAGAMLGAPTTSGAQEATDDGTQAPPADAPERHGPRGMHLSVAADAIGIPEEDLLAALRDGQSLAEVAEANGVDPQVVVDALVQAAIDSGRFTEDDRADLTERITERVNEAGFGPGPGGPGHGRGFGRELPLVAETIGISVDDLRTALEGGQTIAEVAEANGVDPQTVIDALVADATEHITARVNGTD